MTDSTRRPASAFAGFWLRVVAFVVDAIVLGLVGWSIGAAWHDGCVRLGPWGRLVGFAVAGGYFAVLDSRVGGAGSLGKRVFGLRVVDAAGAPIGLARAALRYAIFGVPYFLNNAQLPMASFALPWSVLLSLGVFGLGAGLLYLIVFNRRTRQSLHDVLTGSFVVVRDAPRPLPASPLARVHGVVVATLLVAAAAVPFVVRPALQSGPFASLLVLQNALAAQPQVRQISVFDGVSARYGAGGAAKEHDITVLAAIDGDPSEGGPLAVVLAGVTLKAYGPAATADFLTIELRRGFDLGIARDWAVRGFMYAPAQWLDRIAGGAQG